MSPRQAIQLAVNHYHAGRLTDAAALCRGVLAQNPNDLDALQLQSLLEAAANRLDSAIELISRAISLNPYITDYFLNLGELQRRAGKLDPAAQSLHRALRLQPENAIAHYNLGVVLADQLQRDAALAEFQRAVEIDPNLSEAHLRIADDMRLRHRFEDSAAAYRRAIQLNPDSAAAHWNYSLLLLQHANFEAGWAEYEWRRRIPSICPPRIFSQPEWTGQPLDGKTIFIHIEQAFGDILHFARFASEIARRGARVLLESHPELLRILKTLRGVDEVIPTNAPLPKFDYHIPLLSLPRILRTNLQTIPAEIPYLHPDPQQTEYWRDRLQPHGEKFKVGLINSGRQMLSDGSDRSIPLALFAPLAASEHVAFFNLQPNNQESAPPGMNWIDHSAELKDFADTSALMANLDLIISIDTAAAHLAGALARPVWPLLLHNPDWRWLLDRDDSPWYPTVRFRQPAEGDWQSVIQLIAKQIQTESKSK